MQKTSTSYMKRAFNDFTIWSLIAFMVFSASGLYMGSSIFGITIFLGGLFIYGLAAFRLHTIFGYYKRAFKSDYNHSRKNLIFYSAILVLPVFLLSPFFALEKPFISEPAEVTLDSSAGTQIDQNKMKIEKLEAQMAEYQQRTKQGNN